jgi:hypothetical protein
MSLESLFLERDSKEYIDDRKRWHLEVSRRSLAEVSNKNTRVLLVRQLLEGDLIPWSEGYTFLKDGLETMRWIAAGGDEPDFVFSNLKKKNEQTELRCQEVWTGEHVAYRCYTCGISENSCMCVYCFDQSDHQGHEFLLYRSTAGGCCDCGGKKCKREKVTNHERS